MLKIKVRGTELFDEATSRVITTPDTVLTLEHSLLSVSRWESKWHKSFLKEGPKSDAESIDYVRCMTITQNVDENVYLSLSMENIAEIRKYIDDPMTATTFNDSGIGKKNRRAITSELIYYWMTIYNIPFSCEKWNFNRLLVLIRVCSIESAPKKKMSKANIMKQNAMLNEQRKKRLNSMG